MHHRQWHTLDPSLSQLSHLGGEMGKIKNIFVVHSLWRGFIWRIRVWGRPTLLQGAISMRQWGHVLENASAKKEWQGQRILQHR